MNDTVLDRIETVAIIITALLLMGFIVGIYRMMKDHKCYLMSDEEFYNTEKCREYWIYRKNNDILP